MVILTGGAPEISTNTPTIQQSSTNDGLYLNPLKVMYSRRQAGYIVGTPASREFPQPKLSQPPWRLP